MSAPTGSERRQGRARRVALALLATTALCPLPLRAQELPGGGTATAGSASIATPSAGQMVIEQSSPRAVIGWSDFSIGAGAGVTFRQPSADAAILNRVTGPLPSRIDGNLSANGQVFLLNPNGIGIGPTGRVDAGAFVASTLGMADEDFLEGRLRFGGTGRAGVSNEGAIAIAEGGYAALLGAEVRNAGTIDAPLGRVGLGAAQQVTLDLSGDGFLQVALPPEMLAEGGALIDHSGRITADGGRIEIRAAAARDAARQAVNLSGIVEARTVSGRSGAIVLGGGDGTVAVSGRISAGAPAAADSDADSGADAGAAPQAGGSIWILGRTVELSGARIDADGAAGGGEILIGGDARGAGALPLAERVTVDAASTIGADALHMGDGGRIVLWSQEHTVFAGRVSARGGQAAGDGGFAEVSGLRDLSFSGRADLSAPAGRTGTLLLDPSNIFVVDPALPHDPSDPNVITNDTLAANLASANVVLDTTSVGTEDGDIVISAPVAWTSGTTLSLYADNDVLLDAAITAPSGGLLIDAAGTITTGAGGAVDIGTFTLSGGSWRQNGATLPAFSAADFQLYSRSGSTANSFLRAAGGDGSAAAPFRLVDVYGLQGIDSADLLGSNFVLANDIDASGTSGWNGGLGFDPIGDRFSDGQTFPFTGTLDGLGFAIDGLTVAGRLESGLFGVTSGATLRDLTLTGASIGGFDLAGGFVASATDTTLSALAIGAGSSVTSGSVAGGLAGGMTGGTIADSASGADVSVTDSTGAVRLGGLAGSATSTGIAGSTASGAVSWTQPGMSHSFMSFPTTLDTSFTIDVGGLVGLHIGDMTGSSFTGTVLATRVDPLGQSLRVGGLAGTRSGMTSDSTAAGTVTVDVDGLELLVGGAIGQLGSAAGDEVLRVGASGAVQVTGPALSEARVAVGGLVGDSGGAISGGSASGDVTVTSLYGTLSVGGLVGDSGGAVADSAASGRVEATSVDSALRAGGFVGANRAGITRSTATGAVAATTGVGGDFVGRADVGGFAGVNLDGAEIAGSAADGAVGLEADAIDGAAVGGFVGTNLGTVASSRAGGAVTLGSGANLGAAGGFAGFAEAGADGTSTIRDSFATGSVTGTFNAVGSAATVVGGAVGGFVGAIDQGAGLDRVHATGDAVAVLNDAGLWALAGGLAGLQSGTLRDVYARGDASVTGPGRGSAGGLVGGLVSFGSVVNAYATGGATATTDAGSSVGGLIGELVLLDAMLPTVTGSFWDSTASGLASSFGGTPLTTAEFQDTEGFRQLAAAQGWSFETTWAPSSAAYHPEHYTTSPVIWALPDAASVVYGTPDQGQLTGSLFGGPGLYLFVPAGETLQSGGGFTSSAFPKGPVGVYPITVVGPVLGSSGQVYRVVVSPAGVTVTPAPLTITAEDRTKVFGETLLLGTTAFQALGLVEGDSVSGVTLTSEGAAATAPAEGSPYAITASDPLGTGLSNYTITYVDGALDVSPAPSQPETPVGPEPDTPVPEPEPEPEPEPDTAPLQQPAPVVPPFVTDLPNPADTFTASIRGLEVQDATDAGEGPEPRPVGGADAAIASATETLGVVRTASTRLEEAVLTCRGEDAAGDLLGCVADALGTYADALEEIALDLPPALSDVSAIIRQAGDEVRATRADAERRMAAATTDAERQAIEREAIEEAAQSVQTAVDEVRKSIALIRADDPALESVFREEGLVIEAALQTVEFELARAIGL